MTVMATTGGSLGRASRAAALRAARSLADELAEVVRALAGDDALGHDTVLGRLLAGEGAPEDLLRLGLPVPGCRLLVVDVPANETALAEVRSTRLPHAWHEEDLVVLVPQRRALTALAHRLSRVAAGARAGASSVLNDPSDLPAALEEARRVRAVTGAALSFADAEWKALAMARLSKDVGRALPMHSPLHELAQLRLDFLGSLSTWLRCNGDVAAAARANGLHPNTLRYRLRSIEKQVGIDLGDHETRLLARLFLGLQDG